MRKTWILSFCLMCSCSVAPDTRELAASVEPGPRLKINLLCLNQRTASLKPSVQPPLRAEHCNASAPDDALFDGFAPVITITPECGYRRVHLTPEHGMHSARVPLARDGSFSAEFPYGVKYSAMRGEAQCASLYRVLVEGSVDCSEESHLGTRAVDARIELIEAPETIARDCPSTFPCTFSAEASLTCAEF